MAVVEFLDLIVVFAVNDFGICLLVSADQAEDQGLEALAVGCVGIDEAAELRSGDNDFQVVGNAELLEGIRDIVAVSACRIQFLKALCQNVFFIPDIKGPEKEVIDQADDKQGSRHGRNKSVGNSFFDGVFSSLLWHFQVKPVLFLRLVSHCHMGIFCRHLHGSLILFFCSVHDSSASNL